MKPFPLARCGRLVSREKAQTLSTGPEPIDLEALGFNKLC